MPADPEGWTQRNIVPAPGDSPPSSSGDVLDSGAPGVEDEAFDPAAAYLAQLGPGSRRTMSEALSKLSNWASDGRCDASQLPWHGLRIEHTAALRTRLASNFAPATANKHLAALRGVLKQCWRKGLMSAEAYQRAIDLPPVRGAAPRKARRLTADDLHQLARACRSDASPAGARDEALLALLYGAHLRRAEAVALRIADYDLESGQLLVRSASREKTRRFEANAEARRALERWILIRGPLEGPLFNPVNKGGRIDLRRLSEQAIYIACQKRASEAGLPPTSPEDLRRANAGNDARIAGQAPSSDLESPMASAMPTSAS